MSVLRPSQDVRPVTEFRAKASAFLDQLHRTGRPVMLTQHGRCAAVLLDVDDVRGPARRTLPFARKGRRWRMTDMIGTLTAAGAAADVAVLRCAEHTLEIVSDAGEGAQKCGQIFGAVSAKMGNGVWTVEIIPAEIQPPARVPEGASGYRIRIGEGPVTNWGDATRLAVAFNEQVLLARHRLGALAPDATLLVEDKWATDDDADIRAAWDAAHGRAAAMPLPDRPGADGSRMPHHRRQSPQGEEHVRARHARLDLPP